MIKYECAYPFLEKRCQDALRARQQYPTKLPLIIERAADQKGMDELKNPKFMMPQNFRMSDVQTVVRKHLAIGKDEGLFLLANGTHVLKSNASLREMFEKHKDEDGFLYIVYAEEKVYG